MKAQRMSKCPTLMMDGGDCPSLVDDNSDDDFELPADGDTTEGGGLAKQRCCCKRGCLAEKFLHEAAHETKEAIHKHNAHQGNDMLTSRIGTHV